MEKGKNADRLNAGLFPDFSVNQATEHLTSIFKPQALQKRFEKRLEIAHACGFLKFAIMAPMGGGSSGEQQSVMYVPGAFACEFAQASDAILGGWGVGTNQRARDRNKPGLFACC